MMLRRPENGITPTTTIRLPWQQARVQIKVLSEDQNNWFALYTLKHCKESWENWTTENDLTNKYFKDALNEIVRISFEIGNTNNNNIDNNKDSNLLFDKFNFPEIKLTGTYKQVRNHLKTNLFERNLNSVENTLKIILSLIEIQNTSNLSAPIHKKLTKKNKEKNVLNRQGEYEEEYPDNNIENIRDAIYAENKKFYYDDDNENQNFDKIACMLSTWLIFWPYSVNAETLNENSLLETVLLDRALFSESRASSITEHIQFVSKAIDHLGHEVVYKR